MKKFLKRLMLGVVTLAVFCCMTPLAFAAEKYHTIYLEPQGGIGVLVSEENKKSEPFSYREKVRIFMVWCG